MEEKNKRCETCLILQKHGEQVGWCQLVGTKDQSSDCPLIENKFDDISASSPYDENGFKPFIIDSEEAAQALIAAFEESEKRNSKKMFTESEIDLGMAKIRKGIGLDSEEKKVLKELKRKKKERDEQ